MTEVSRQLRNIFFCKIPPILKHEVGFFSEKVADFSKLENFIFSELGKKIQQNQRNFLER